MSTQNKTRSSLFLIELIIAILFFSLGSAVCVQAFVKAHTITADARDLSFASSSVSSAASVLKYTDGGLDEVRAYYPNAYEDGDDIAVCYDADFAPCDGEAAAYTMRIHADTAAGVETAHIRMDRQDGASLYELELRWPAV